MFYIEGGGVTLPKIAKCLIFIEFLCDFGWLNLFRLILFIRISIYISSMESQSHKGGYTPSTLAHRGNRPHRLLAN